MVQAQQAQQVVKTGIDVGAVAVAGASLFDMLPKVAAAFSIVWLGIQIYEYFKKKYFGKGKGD